MSKKNSFGKFLALAAVVGTAAAAVSYFIRYKSFSRELDEDFHDFEGEDDDAFEEEQAPRRNYVTLPPKVEEVLKEATGQAVEKAKNAANIVKETVKNAAEKSKAAGKEAAESCGDAADAAADAADSAKDALQDAAETAEEAVQDAAETAEEAVQDAAEEFDLFGQGDEEPSAPADAEDARKTSSGSATIVDDEQ